MLNPDASEGGPSPTAALLDKLATALDCPVAAFSQPTLSDPAQTAELLRLWLMLGHEQDRLKALSFISTLALRTDPPQSR